MNMTTMMILVRLFCINKKTEQDVDNKDNEDPDVNKVENIEDIEDF